MATYGLNPTQLIDSSDELRQVTAKIEATMAELNGHVNQLINQNAGNAAAAYQQAQNTWNQGLDRMRAGLVRGASALDEILQNYVNTDRSGANLFS